MLDPMHEAVQQLLGRLRTGDGSAWNELTPTLYNELHRIASLHMRGERPGHTLQPTALVNEAYLKLFGGHVHPFADRVHFLAVASRVMRQVLVDYARARASLKRSNVAEAGPANRNTSLEVKTGEGVELLDLIELDGALHDLAAESEPLAKLIELRYFGGLTAEETSGVLGLSVHIVRHDLRYAQAWLKRRLSQ